MKRFLPFFMIYVLIQQNGQTSRASWSDGQPIDSFLQGKTYQVVTKAVFDATLDPLPVIDPEKQAQVQQDILDAKDSKKSIAQRLDALIAAEGL